MSDHSDALSQFVGITSADIDIAKKYLEACSWNVQTAIERFFATNGNVDMLAPQRPAPPASSGPVASEPTASAMGYSNPLSSFFGGGGMGGLGGLGGFGMGGGVPQSAAPPAASAFGNEPGVRAPDQAVRDQMLPSNFSVFGSRDRRSRDPLRNFGDEWADAPPTANRRSRTRAQQEKSDQHRAKLAQMFRAPEYSCKGNLDDACREGKENNAWVLVNLQDKEEFSSHILNRDCWKSEELAEVVQANFVLWQKEKEQEDGRRFKTYYNVAKLPTIYVIDPRTKRHEATISIPNKPTADFLLAKLMEFLQTHDQPMSSGFGGSAAPSSGPVVSPESTSAVVTQPSVEAMDEDDEDLMAAIAMSMAEESAPQPIEEDEPEISLPAEPDDGPNTCAIRVTMPDGKTLQRRFVRTDQIQMLYDWINVEANPDKESLLLFIPMPRENLTDKSKTLQQMGLNRARIVCSFQDS